MKVKAYRDDIFGFSENNADLAIVFGQHGFTGFDCYWHSFQQKHEMLSMRNHPGNESYERLIPLRDGSIRLKNLIFLKNPGNRMTISDNELLDTMIRVIAKVQTLPDNEKRVISFNGASSEPYSDRRNEEADDIRAMLIVGIFTALLSKEAFEVQELKLVSLGEVFTRMFPEPVQICRQNKILD